MARLNFFVAFREREVEDFVFLFLIYDCIGLMSGKMFMKSRVICMVFFVYFIVLYLFMFRRVFS